MKKNKAFTLIEILIVVSVVMLIMVSISGIMGGVFNSQSKNKAIDKITQNGNWILNELKKNVLNANGGDVNGGMYFDCQNNSIKITSVKDGETSLISCSGNNNDYKIASYSAKRNETVYLFQKNDDLLLDGCTNFVSCSTLPSLQLNSVSFNLTLRSGVDGLSSGTSKAFVLDVTLRN